MIGKSIALFGGICGSECKPTVCARSDVNLGCQDLLIIRIVSKLLMTPSLRCRTFLTRVPVLQAPKLRQLPDMTEPLGHLTAQRRETSMKTSVSFAYCLAIAMMVFASNCDAQQPYVSGAIGAGGQICEPANGIATGMAPIQTPWPGRVWFGTNFADQAVGYEGIYASLGLKTRLCEDLLDGRWLTEARLHQSLDGGGFFTNIGLERVFSIDSANADVTVGAWFDYDAGTNADFSHTFYQVGVNAAIKSRNWDLIGNGYFPTDTAGYTQGDPNGNVPFYQHRIVLIPGIDTALEGFDTTLRIRPPVFAYLNGSVDVGAYGYSSDIIEFFAGGRTRLNAQLWDGLIVSGEIAYDDRFDLTGAVNLTYMFGVNARGSEYAGIGRDLERTVRNDRIVRYNQEVVYAIDPDTGAPYNVIHVNNGERPALVIADGSFEAPFFSLADAEAASKTNDIIWVDEGNGTVEGYDTGIQLKDHQMLLGDGVRHLIPIANGLPWGDSYELIYHLDNNRPNITGNIGQNFGDAVNLSNHNVVAGFVINGNQSTDGMRFGIAGIAVQDATIEDNSINGAIFDGVNILGAEGVLTFQRNVIGEFSVGPGADRPNGGNGISIEDFVDVNGQLIVRNNNLVGNGDGTGGILGGNGLQLLGYNLANRDNFHNVIEEPVGVLIENNVVSNNLNDGIRLAENLYAPSLTGPTAASHTTDIDMISNQLTFNGGSGINITNELILGVGDMGGGHLRILETTSTDNSGAGIRIENWTNQRLDQNGFPTADKTIIASRFDGPTSNISQNGRGIEVIMGDAQLNNHAWNQNLIVSEATVDNNNGTGIRATVNGVGAVMNTEIVDNLSVSDNGVNGIALTSLGGSLHRAIIENSAAAVGPTVLDLDNNGGSAIDIVAGDSLGNGSHSHVEALIRNVATTGSGNHGINISSSGSAHVNVFVENAFSVGNTAHGINLDVRDEDGPPHFPNVVNQLTVNDSFMDTNGGNGLTVRTYGGKTDVLVQGSTFDNNLGTLARSDVFQVPIIRTGYGIDVTATNDILLLPNDEPNYTRIQVYGSRMDGNARSGLTMETRETANLYATIDGNQMTNNGFTFEEFTFSFLIWEFRVPYTKLNDRGVDIAAYDRSRFYLDMSNNFISGNGEEGLSMHVATNDSIAPPPGQQSAAQLNAWLKDNSITGNDLRADGLFVPGERDIQFVNGGLLGGLNNGLFNLAMSNNAIAVNPAVTDVQMFFNYAAQNRFNIGLDGVTNGFSNIDITNDILLGNNFDFTPGPYDTVVGAELLAAWADFLAEGFPLMPPP